jgi:FKBP-type peptidyl-prolyl cis-trans isomerase
MPFEEVGPEGKEVTTASGLQYIDLKLGTGVPARAGQTVSVHYSGWLENGKRFDSSLERGQPFSFPLGAGRVIKGWDEGVQGMQVGGKRKLIIPSNLGYGASGAGNVIPPHATLIFEVELLSL